MWSCDSSRDTARSSTRPPTCHRSDSWDASRVAHRPTSIPSRKWLRSCSRHAACCPDTGCDPPPTAPYFALLVSTGLRLSEACRLTTDDVDLVNGILTIRKTKFRKSRLVPLHPTTTQALARYANRRDACRAAPRSEYFFRTEHSPRLGRDAVEKTFGRIRQRLGWTGHGRTRQPRIHDLRHTFVTRRLLRWYQNGADVDHKILALATYLGHAKVTDTYWYCTAVPELLASTAQRFERFTHRASERPS